MSIKNVVVFTICMGISILLLILSVGYSITYRSNLIKTKCEIIDTRIITTSYGYKCAEFKSLIDLQDNFCSDITRLWVEWKCVTSDIQKLKKDIYNELKIGKIYDECYYDSVYCDLIIVGKPNSEYWYNGLVYCVIILFSFYLLFYLSYILTNNRRNIVEEVVEEEIIELKILPPPY